MPRHAHPTPQRFKVYVGGELFEVDGWASAHTLGIAPSSDGFASVMLMAGAVLADGFTTIEAAHAFNLVVLDEAKLFVGTPRLDEFYARAGGADSAALLIEKAKRRASE